MEARTAVQKHIEKMLHNNNSNNVATSSNGGPVNGTGDGNQARSPLMQPLHQKNENNIKHTMHGVSHAIPGELDDIEKPPPVHYGVDAAIRSGSVALKQQPARNYFSNENLMNIVKEPSLARGTSTDSIINVRVTSPETSPSPTSPAFGSVSPLNKKIIHVSNRGSDQNATGSPKLNTSEQGKDHKSFAKHAK